MHVSHMASVPHSVMISLVALTVHPFMRRRELAATWHRTYKFMSDHKDSRGTLLSLLADIREELCFAGLLTGVAHADIHSQIDTHISAMDATPIAAGAVNSQVSRRVEEALYRSLYYKGGHCKLVLDQILDATLLGEVESEVDPLTAQVVKFIPWKVSRCYNFSDSAHINLQEVKGVSEELRARVKRSLTPARGINFADSMVTIGAWGHGRSSSFLLNGLLRKNVGWFVMVRKTLDNLHAGTKDNPADDPSRREELRKPEPAADWLEPLLVPQAMRRHAPPRPPSGRELKSGAVRWLQRADICAMESRSASRMPLRVLRQRPVR